MRTTIVTCDKCGADITAAPVPRQSLRVDLDGMVYHLDFCPDCLPLLLDYLGFAK